MQTIVIIFNVTLACCCLAVARWIWVFRRSLRRSTQALVLAEMVIHETLKDAPSQIEQGRFNIQRWQQLSAQVDSAMMQGKAILRWTQLTQRMGHFIMGQTWKIRRHQRH